MAANYVLLEKITVGAAGASSVTFSGIPQTGYTDLVLKTSTRNSGSNVGNFSAFTIAGAYNPNGLFVRGNGSVASSGNSQYGQMETGGGATASSFSNTETYFPNYTSAAYKSLSSDSAVENNATEGYNNLSAGVVANTSAITSLTITCATGTFVQYSSFYLYGVAKLGTTPAISPKATGGDTIMTDGTYWYHAFLSSGTFTPIQSLSSQIMVVGGGGGGGGNIGSGGGAGAMTTFSTTSSLSSGVAYTCTVGAAAAGGSGSANGTQGNTSSFSGSGFTTITALGGGAGRQSTSGVTGGSGSGGAPTAGSTGGGASGPNTNVGGTGYYSYPIYSGGGGGGATGVGGNGSTGASVGGNGGTGYTISSIDSYLTTILSPMTVIAAGGAGAGVRPDGAGNSQVGGTSTGGGNGGYSSTNATSASTYGSGGGGGTWTNFASGNGGSGYQGLVIVRYLV